MNALVHAAPQPSLRPVQRDAFVADGFLIMRALAGAEQLDAMRTVALDLLRRRQRADARHPVGAPGPIRVREAGDA